MGVFSVSPCTGTLQPGSQQVVTVNCVADQLGSWKQDLLIDISDRDPSDHPVGIPYRLMAEVCKPGEFHKILSYLNAAVGEFHTMDAFSVSMSYEIM